MKTESHGDRWWSKVRCKCGQMMDSQRWGNGLYRISCMNCGEVFMSLLADGSDGPQDTPK